MYRYKKLLDAFQNINSRSETRTSAIQAYSTAKQSSDTGEMKLSQKEKRIKNAEVIEDGTKVSIKIQETDRASVMRLVQDQIKTSVKNSPKNSEGLQGVEKSFNLSQRNLLDLGKNLSRQKAHEAQKRRTSYISGSSAYMSFRGCTPSQIRSLCNILKDIKFFSDRSITNMHDLQEIALNLLLEQFHPGQMVFDHGDAGDKFYIILKGQVGVYIPIRVKVEHEELERRTTLFESEKTKLVQYIKHLEEEEQCLAEVQDEIIKAHASNKAKSQMAKCAQANKKSQFDKSQEVLRRNLMTSQGDEGSQSKEKSKGVAKPSSQFSSLARSIPKITEDAADVGRQYHKTPGGISGAGLRIGFHNQTQLDKQQSPQGALSDLSMKIIHNLKFHRMDQKRDKGQVGDNKLIKKFLMKYKQGHRTEFEERKEMEMSQSSNEKQKHHQSPITNHEEGSLLRPSTKQGESSYKKRTNFEVVRPSKKQTQIIGPAQTQQSSIQVANLVELKFQKKTEAEECFKKQGTLSVSQNKQQSHFERGFDTSHQNSKGTDAFRQQIMAPFAQDKAVEDSQRLSSKEDRPLTPLLEREQKLKDYIIDLHSKIEECEVKIGSIKLSNYEMIYKRVAVLREGDSFGELALIDSKKGTRAARIVAIDPMDQGNPLTESGSDLLSRGKVQEEGVVPEQQAEGQTIFMGVISAEDYNKSLAKIERKKRDALVNFLCCIPALQNLLRPHIIRLLNSMNQTVFVKGQIIICDGVIEQKTKQKLIEEVPLEEQKTRFLKSPKKNKIKEEEDSRQTDYQASSDSASKEDDGDEREGIQPQIFKHNQLMLSSGLNNDDVYFIMEGEFALLQQIPLDDLDYNRIAQKREKQKNMRFLNIQEQIKAEFNVQDEVPDQQNYEIGDNANKFSLEKQNRIDLPALTTSYNLSQVKKRTQYIELARLGPGRVIGEIPFVIEGLRYYQPYSAKCVSLEAKVLRISGHEFDKKILCHRQVFHSFQAQALSNFQKFEEQKIKVMLNMINFQKEFDRIDTSPPPKKCDTRVETEKKAESPKEIANKHYYKDDLHVQCLSASLNLVPKNKIKDLFPKKLGNLPQHDDKSDDNRPTLGDDQLSQKKKKRNVRKKKGISKVEIKVFDQRRASLYAEHALVLQQQQSSEVRQEKTSPPQQPKGICKEELELKKRIMQDTVDKRDAIQQIVEGYPKVDQITNLDLLSDFRSLQNDAPQNLVSQRRSPMSAMSPESPASPASPHGVLSSLSSVDHKKNAKKYGVKTQKKSYEQWLRKIRFKERRTVTQKGVKDSGNRFYISSRVIDAFQKERLRYFHERNQNLSLNKSPRDFSEQLQKYIQNQNKAGIFSARDAGTRTAEPGFMSIFKDAQANENNQTLYKGGLFNTSLDTNVIKKQLQQILENKKKVQEQYLSSQLGRNVLTPEARTHKIMVFENKKGVKSRDQSRIDYPEGYSLESTERDNYLSGNILSTNSKQSWKQIKEATSFDTGHAKTIYQSGVKNHANFKDIVSASISNTSARFTSNNFVSKSRPTSGAAQDIKVDQNGVIIDQYYHYKKGELSPISEIMRKNNPMDSQQEFKNRRLYQPANLKLGNNPIYNINQFVQGSQFRGQQQQVPHRGQTILQPQSTEKRSLVDSEQQQNYQAQATTNNEEIPDLILSAYAFQTPKVINLFEQRLTDREAKEHPDGGSAQVTGGRINLEEMINLDQQIQTQDLEEIKLRSKRKVDFQKKTQRTNNESLDSRINLQLQEQNLSSYIAYNKLRKMREPRGWFNGKMPDASIRHPFIKEEKSPIRTSIKIKSNILKQLASQNVESKKMKDKVDLILSQSYQPSTEFKIDSGTNLAATVENSPVFTKAEQAISFKLAQKQMTEQLELDSSINKPDCLRMASPKSGESGQKVETKEPFTEEDVRNQTDQDIVMYDDPIEAPRINLLSNCEVTIQNKKRESKKARAVLYSNTAAQGRFKANKTGLKERAVQAKFSESRMPVEEVNTSTHQSLHGLQMQNRYSPTIYPQPSRTLSLSPQQKQQNLNRRIKKEAQGVTNSLSSNQPGYQNLLFGHNTKIMPVARTLKRVYKY